MKARHERKQAAAVAEEARAVQRAAAAPRENEVPAESVPPEFRAAVPCRLCAGDGELDEEPVTGKKAPCWCCEGEGFLYVDVRRLKPRRAS